METWCFLLQDLQEYDEVLERTITHVALVASTLGAKLNISSVAAGELAEIEVSSGLRLMMTRPWLRRVVVHPGGGVVEGHQIQPGVHILVLRRWVSVVLKVAAGAGSTVIVVETMGSFANVGNGTAIG